MDMPAKSAMACDGMQSQRSQWRGGAVSGSLAMKINNHHQVTAKSADTEFADQLLLLLGRIHAQKAQGLPFASLPCGKDVQPGDGAKT
jgi:hypothetical protein